MFLNVSSNLYEIFHKILIRFFVEFWYFDIQVWHLRFETNSENLHTTFELSTKTLFKYVHP